MVSNTSARLDNNAEENVQYFVIPYVENISEKVASAIKKNSNRIVGYRCVKKLDSFIRVHKDVNDKNKNSNVIYKINCKDCDGSYVGQTKRQLCTRIK